MPSECRCKADLRGNFEAGLEYCRRHRTRCKLAWRRPWWSACRTCLSPQSDSLPFQKLLDHRSHNLFPIRTVVGVLSGPLTGKSCLPRLALLPDCSCLSRWPPKLCSQTRMETDRLLVHRFDQFLWSPSCLLSTFGQWMRRSFASVSHSQQEAALTASQEGNCFSSGLVHLSAQQLPVCLQIPAESHQVMDSSWTVLHLDLCSDRDRCHGKPFPGQENGLYCLQVVWEENRPEKSEMTVCLRYC